MKKKITLFKQTSAEHTFTTVVPPYLSDDIPELRKQQTLPQSAPLLTPIAIVIDANRAMPTIAAKARFALVETRTPIEEAVSAGVLQVFAPEFLEVEIQKHLCSLYPKIDRKRLELAAAHFLKSICLLPAPSVSSPAIERLRQRDPKDVPYAQLFERVKADAILSNDRDFDAAGYRRISHPDFDIMVLLRDYARVAAQERGQGLFVASSTFAGVAVARGIYDWVSNKASWWIKAPAFLFLGVGLAHRKTSAVLGAIWKPVDESVLSSAAELSSDYQKARVDSEKIRTRILEVLGGTPRRLPLGDLAYRICLYEKRPLAVEEIEQLLLVSGYHSSRKGSRLYLLRVLRKDKRLVSSRNGYWEVRAVPPSAISAANDLEHSAR